MVKWSTGRLGITCSFGTVFILCLIASCSSVRKSGGLPEYRAYLSDGVKQVLVLRPQLQFRSVETLFGGRDIGQQMQEQAGLTNPLIEAIQELGGEHGAEHLDIVELRPDTRAAMSALDPNELVLFVFSGGWYLDYRRLPLSLSTYRLSMGVVAKIVPRGVVLSGRGTLALPASLPHDTCHFTSDWQALSRWQQNNSQLVKHETEKGLEECRAPLLALLLPPDSAIEQIEVER